MANQTKGWGIGLRPSPLSTVMRVLPTPVRPWLMAYDVISELRVMGLEYRHGRREASLTRQLARAQAARGGGLRAIALGIGLGWLGSRLLPQALAGPRLRVTGFVEEALEGGVSGARDALDRVQSVVDDGFGRARQAAGGRRDLG